MEVIEASGGDVDEDGLLEPIGRGVQADVFGTGRWVVKVRRFSMLGTLAKLISSKHWKQEVHDGLGGLVAPFLLLDEVAFRAPKMRGRGGRVIEYRDRGAVVRERYPTDQFLDHRLSLAEPADALALVEEMVVLVERVRARGFCMIDFCMSNFAVIDGRLMIVDADLIAPIRSLWEPGLRTCAAGFARGLSKDYQRLLGELGDEVEDDANLSDEIASLSEALPKRIGRLRKRSLPGLETEPAVPVEFDADLAAEIRAALCPPSPGLKK